MKRILRTKELKTGDNSGIVISGHEKVSYIDSYSAVDFLPNELVNFSTVATMVSGVIQLGSTIEPWGPGLIVDSDNYVTHEYQGVEYLFRSIADDNASEPAIDNATWSTIGGGIQIAYAGPNAPLLSLGKNGDLYYIVPNDSSFIELRQKISGSWVAVFTVPLVTSGVVSVTKNQSDLIDDGFGGYVLKFDMPAGLSLGSAITKSGTVTTTIDSSLSITDTSLSPNTTLSGFANNSNQTITLKLI